jgi:hypothetical protein
VVPLEIQLGTCLSRGLQDRAAAIIAVLRENGHDRKLVEMALNRVHMEVFESLMEGQRDQHGPGQCNCRSPVGVCRAVL